MVDEKDKNKIMEIVGEWLQARIFLEQEVKEIGLEISDNEIIYCINRTIEDLNKWKMSDKISNEKNERMSRFDKQKVQEPDLEKPTDKQIDFMRKHNIAYIELGKNKTTKKEASELIAKEIDSWGN